MVQQGDHMRKETGSSYIGGGWSFTRELFGNEMLGDLGITLLKSSDKLVLNSFTNLTFDNASHHGIQDLVKCTIIRSVLAQEEQWCHDMQF